MRAPVPDEIFEALARDATIITPNERAARGVRRAWDHRQHALGLTRWSSPAALSWRTWLDTLWRDLLLRGAGDQLLLSTAQEHLLWGQILRDDAGTHHLRRNDDLAAMCARGYRRLHDYNAAPRWQAMRDTLSGDPAAFALWVQQFEERCQREHLLSRAALPSRLTSRLLDGALSAAGEEVVLLGFDTLLPSQETLLAAWEHTGGLVSISPSPRPSPDGLLIEAPDRAAELRGFARWARERIASNPDQTIALVVEDVAAERDEIESVLREILSPELEDIRRNGDSLPFELSLGRPLHAEPLIRAALDLLRWTQGPLSREVIERLLLGPAFGDVNAERAARAELDRELRREMRLIPEATMEEVLDLIERSTRLSYPLAGLRRELRAVGRVTAAVPLDVRQSFTTWAEFIRAVLLAARWAEHPSSRSYQLRERWERLLDSLATLDFAASPVQWSEVMETLRRLAQETVFAPQSRNAPVQVLGPAEAAGSQFDALWVLHTAQMEWPPAQTAHPLLPPAFARACGMPGSDREADRRHSRSITERLAGSASQVIFSFAGRSAGGARQRPAADVAELDLSPLPLPALAPEDLPRAPLRLEHLADLTPLPPLRTPAVRGGVRVLEMQAQCGFRAFAELRLHAEELSTSSFGLSPAERGSVVHTALEKLWGCIKSQATLRALSQQQQTSILDESIELALAKASRRGEDAWSKSYVDVQRQRLRTLLRRWLQQELLRPDFTVSQQETKQAGNIGPLQLSFRVDRIDLVEGKQVLLDYKTSPALTGQWRGDRPDRPQLPLYAVLADAAAKRETAASVEASLPSAPPLGAIAFAIVVPGQRMGMLGFERNEGGLLPQAKHRQRMDADDFGEQVAQWAEILARLASAFADGDARVRPKQFPKSCLHCGQGLLCRVDPASFEETLDDTEEAGGFGDG